MLSEALVMRWLWAPLLAPRGPRIAGVALLATLWFISASSSLQAVELATPLERASLSTPRAIGAALLGIAQAGSRLVAVGERGVVLLSDDAGKSWRQVEVPVSVTLTAVRFVDAQRGWAVGHSGVVLHTGDAGQTWVRQLDGRAAALLAVDAAQGGNDAAGLKAAQRLVADGPDKPFLDLYFFDARRGFVVGAYGLIYGTEDGGVTWSSWMPRVPNPQGLHLNAIAVSASASTSHIVLAGEQGLLLRSMDGGQSFVRVASPYPGSWFAVTYVAPDRVVLGGLRGNAQVCDDTLTRCFKSDVPIPVTLTALQRLGDGSVFALNQAGQALLSRDAGQHFMPLGLPPGPPLTAVIERGEGRLWASSLRGARALSLPSALKKSP